MNSWVSGTNTIAPTGMPSPTKATAAPRRLTNHLSIGTDVTRAPGPLIPTRPITANSATSCQLLLTEGERHHGAPGDYGGDGQQNSRAVLVQQPPDGRAGHGTRHLAGCLGPTEVGAADTQIVTHRLDEQAEVQRPHRHAHGAGCGHDEDDNPAVVEEWLVTP